MGESGGDSSAGVKTLVRISCRSEHVDCGRLEITGPAVDDDAGGDVTHEEMTSSVGSKGIVLWYGPSISTDALVSGSWA